MNRNDQEYLVQQIRTKYTEREHTSLDKLKALDHKVSRPASIFAYIFGSIAALMLGCGMSLVMTDIGQKIGVENNLISGIIIGICGICMACANYPAYKAILCARRKKYSEQIISLSNKIMKK